MSELFPSTFKRKYFPRFQSLVFQRMLSMDIQSLRSLAQNQRSNGIARFRVPPEVFLRCSVRGSRVPQQCGDRASHLTRTPHTGNVLKGEEADRALEVFKLRLAKRLMSTPFFTLKLRGSDDLVEQINMTLRRERRDSLRTGDREKTNPPRRRNAQSILSR